MKPRQLSLLICTYSYGGNGNIASTNPFLTTWLMRLQRALETDERIAAWRLRDQVDTPITMTRNKSVLMAREDKADLLLMVDSDSFPDFHVDIEPLPGMRRFWDSSFDFLYKHYDRGPVLVAAPYCGPPPCENVYVFKWETEMSVETVESDLKIVQFTRSEAHHLGGIQEVAALPTGLSLWDMRLFELTEPRKKGDDPWFYYQWNDIYQSEKASTEDVTATRDISLAGCRVLGYNPIFCNWDAWCGHIKTRIVGKPRLLTPLDVSEKLQRAMNRVPADRRTIEVKSDFADQVDWSKAERVSESTLESEPELQETSPQRVPRRIGSKMVVSVGFMTDVLDLQVLAKLVEEISETDSPIRILEIGSWVGESVVTMAEAALALKRPCFIDCIDTWEGTDGDDPNHPFVEQIGGPKALFAQFKANAHHKYCDDPLIRIYAHKERFEEYAGRFRDDWFNLIFYDASHERKYNELATRLYLPKLKPGGRFVYHDYDYPLFPGVRLAVDGMFGEENVSHEGKYMAVIRDARSVYEKRQKSGSCCEDGNGSSN